MKFFIWCVLTLLSGASLYNNLINKNELWAPVSVIWFSISISVLITNFITNSADKRDAAQRHRMEKIGYFWGPDKHPQQRWIEYHYAIYPAGYASDCQVGYKTELLWDEDFNTCLLDAANGSVEAKDLLQRFYVWRLTQ